MKKIRILTLLFAFVMACGSLSAQSLVVNGHDGSSASFAINTSSKVLFGNNLVTVYADKSQSFSLGEVKSIKFGGTTGIDPLAANQGEVSITRDGKLITVNGCDQGAVSVYSANGQLVSQNKAWNGGTIDLSQLGRGVYVLKVGNKSFKITL